MYTERCYRMEKQVNLINTPKIITEEWLKEMLNNNLFSIWDFSFSNISDCSFDKNISEGIINKVVISTKTKLSKEHPFNINMDSYTDKSIKEIHKLGIDGKSIINPIDMIKTLSMKNEENKNHGY